MNHFTSLKKAIVAIACLISAQSFAQTAPTEKTSAQIQRTATSANPATATLTKNLFRNEDYQAPYTVQVPYQETETYTVDVPYQVDENYTVQVPYEETETYTENVPYDVSVPYTDYETSYRNENQCNTVTRYRQECHNEQQCYLVPGTGGGRQCRQVEECGTNVAGQQICKTREVCEGQDSPPQQRCDNKQVCENQPYQEQECHVVQIPVQTPVTRYRNETRYRQEQRTRTVTQCRNETRTHTVTKTRTETRTREVTKYRTDEKCCVTKTRQVFDRQLSYNVNVVFPQEAILAGAESETIVVKIVSADANSAQVQVDVVNSIYGYKIANQSVAGSSVQVDLALTPKYDLTNAGASTIQNLKVDYVAGAQKFQVSFNDTVTSSRVRNAYAIVITDLASGALIEQLPVTALANGKLGALTTAALDSQSKIRATLKVNRSGVLIVGSEINFEKSVNFEKRAVLKNDVAALSDVKNIGGQPVGKGAETAFQMIDQTTEFLDVSTTYAIFLTAKMPSGDQALKTTTISREALKSQGMSLKLADLFKNASDAQNALVAGRVVKFSIHATRKGAAAGALAGQSIKIETSGRFTLQ